MCVCVCLYFCVCVHKRRGQTHHGRTNASLAWIPSTYCTTRPNVFFHLERNNIWVYYLIYIFVFVHSLELQSLTVLYWLILADGWCFYRLLERRKWDCIVVMCDRNWCLEITVRLRTQTRRYHRGIDNEQDWTRPKNLEEGYLKGTWRVLTRIVSWWQGDKMWQALFGPEKACHQSRPPEGLDRSQPPRVSVTRCTMQYFQSVQPNAYTTYRNLLTWLILILTEGSTWLKLNLQFLLLCSLWSNASGPLQCRQGPARPDAAPVAHAAWHWHTEIES